MEPLLVRGYGSGKNFYTDLKELLLSLCLRTSRQPRLLVASDAVVGDGEGPFAVVTFAAVFAGVEVAHGDLDASFFHIGENCGVVTVAAGNAGIFVGLAVENDHSFRAAGKLDHFARTDSVCRTCER